MLVLSHNILRNSNEPLLRVSTAEVKDAKDADYAEPKVCGVNQQEKDRRQEHQRNTQTCGLSPAEKLEKQNNFRKKYKIYHQKIPARVFFDVLTSFFGGGYY